ncbi:MAG: hypothetical protein Q9190_001396 [Brigantiaea leucoxantha]
MTAPTTAPVLVEEEVEDEEALVLVTAAVDPTVSVCFVAEETEEGGPDGEDTTVDEGLGIAEYGAANDFSVERDAALKSAVGQLPSEQGLETQHPKNEGSVAAQVHHSDPSGQLLPGMSE